MKGLILVFLLTMIYHIGVAQQLQSQIQAKRGVFTERLYLNGNWIDRVSTDLNTPDSTSDNLVPTAKAVADHIRSKTMPVNLQQVLSAGATLTKTNIVNGGNNLYVWNNNLSNGNLFRYRIDYSGSKVTNTIYSPTFETVSELTQSSSLNSLYNSGSKITNQFNQYSTGGTLILTGAHYTFRESGLLMDTAYLTLLSGNAGGVEHRINIHRDSIQIRGYSGNTNLILRGLPSSTSNSDSALVKLPDGRLAYRASDNAAGGLWTNTENNIYSTNSGNTGIGLNNPTAKLHIRSLEFSSEGVTNYINPIWNTSGNPTAFKVNPQVISNGGASLLADFQYSGMPRLSIRHDGLLTLSGYVNGAFTGTPAYDLQLNSSGEVIKKATPKIYTAIISQVGTNDPSVTVLDNTIGNIIWQRTGPGVYAGTLLEAFPSGKTVILNGSGNILAGSASSLYVFRSDANTITVNGTGNTGSPIDGLDGVSVEIRVYP